MLAETRRQPPIYLLTPGAGTDSYGDPLNDWATPERTLIPGATLQAHATFDKDVATGSNTDRTGTLIAVGQPTGALTQITEQSRIEQDGIVWRVNGTPNFKRGLMLGNSHLTASLTRTTTEAPNG